VTEVERRKMERFSLELPALLSMMDESGIHKSLDVMTKNICSDGAFFITYTPMSVGTDVKMDLILSLNIDDKFNEIKTHIDVSGAVIRTEEHGIAVCFDRKPNISPLDS
jgi:PilZ domain